MDHREANGPFTVAEDLLAVSGIGEKKFAAVPDSCRSDDPVGNGSRRSRPRAEPDVATT